MPHKKKLIFLVVAGLAFAFSGCSLFQKNCGCPSFGQKTMPDAAKVCMHTGTDQVRI